jgi:hypothetical protein
MNGSPFETTALLVSWDVGRCNDIARKLAGLLENLLEVFRLHALERVERENVLDVCKVADAKIDVGERRVVSARRASDRVCMLKITTKF